MSLPFDVHRLLPAFLAAAQAQNFSAAARQLGVTPAAVSKNIRALEEKLALRLFQRRIAQPNRKPGARILEKVEV